MRGKIIKGVGSFYTVYCDNTEYICRARGRFRQDGVTPMVGDMVEFEPRRDGEGFLKTIMPRKNALIRPPAANLDQLVIVIAASAPKPDLLLVDKLLVQCAILDVQPIIAVNKCDEMNNEIYERIIGEYQACGYPLLSVSAASGEGIHALKPLLKGKTTCFAGQSAVGKSSVLNALFPELSLKTGGLSRKTERGKHTTRHAQFLILPDDVAVLDTPGFSLLEMEGIEPELLSQFYPEMQGRAQLCRFRGCMHISEPDCAVKELVAAGGLAPGRYERYIAIAGELIERKKRQYD